MLKRTPKEMDRFLEFMEEHEIDLYMMLDGLFYIYSKKVSEMEEEIKNLKDSGYIEVKNQLEEYQSRVDKYRNELLNLYAFKLSMKA